MAKRKKLCDGCGLRLSTVKEIRRRVEGKATQYEFLSRHWCGSCRAKQRGNFKLV